MANSADPDQTAPLWVPTVNYSSFIFWSLLSLPNIQVFDSHIYFNYMYLVFYAGFTMDSDLETPRHEMDFNDTNMSHSLEMGKYQQDDPYLQVDSVTF